MNFQMFKLVLEKTEEPEIKLPTSTGSWKKQATAAKSLQSCLTVRPHRQQPTRLPRPWDSPGKNTGVGCHFLLQCRKGKSESEVTQSCPTLSDPTDHSFPGSSVHGIFQARVLSGSPLPSLCTSVTDANFKRLNNSKKIQTNINTIIFQ